MKEKLVIPSDLPDFSYIAIAPNGKEYVAVPVSFGVPEVCYRLLVDFGMARGLSFESPDAVARWIVEGWCSRILRSDHLSSKEVSSDE